MYKSTKHKFSMDNNNILPREKKKKKDYKLSKKKQNLPGTIHVFGNRKIEVNIASIIQI